MKKLLIGVTGFVASSRNDVRDFVKAESFGGNREWSMTKEAMDLYCPMSSDSASWKRRMTLWSFGSKMKG